jgi:hypothetical protein
MALDFTTGVLDPRVTVVRTLNTATRTNSSGALEIVNANLPRFDYNPTTLAARGLLIEELRINLFLNSLINGASLSTQTVTVAAIAYTISFYGTGTVTLSGATTATVTGTGVYPNRRTLTFTPTAGALICTVTGSVQYAQLEAGAFATSFIPTAGTIATRDADQVSMTGTNFSSWYNAGEGTFYARGSRNNDASFSALVAVSSDASNEMYMTQTSSRVFAFIRSSAGTPGDLTGQVNSWIGGTVGSAVFAYKLNNAALAVNANATVTDTTVSIPSVNKLNIGARSIGTFMNGHIQRVSYWPQRLINAEAQAFSK